MKSIQFGLCSISIFISFFFAFLLFLSVFSLTDTDGSWDGTGNNYFACFPLPPTKHSFNWSRFLPLIFTQSICSYETYSWWDLDICILLAFLWMQLSRSYRLWHFKVTLWEFEFISNCHPSITKRTPYQRLTPLPVTVYLSQLPSSTSNLFPKCIRN